MMRAVGCVAATGAALGLQHAGVIPTWLAVTVGVLAMTCATVLVALEEIR